MQCQTGFHSHFYCPVNSMATGSRVPVDTPIHWLKIPERIHFKVLSLTYNSLQSSQPTYLRELFTIQPTCSIRSSSCLTLSRPPVASHLMFSNHHCTTSLE